MKVAISGGTGLIGRALVKALLEKNHEPTEHEWGRITAACGGPPRRRHDENLFVVINGRKAPECSHLQSD